MIDDIGLEVEPDDLDVPLVHDREQVVEREGEIRLAGAEVDDAERSSAGSAGSTSSTSSRKRFTWRNLSKRCARTLPSAVITPSSTRNGTGTPSGSTRCLTRSCPSATVGRVGGRRRIFASLPLPPASTCQSASVDWSTPCRNSLPSRCTRRSAAASGGRFSSLVRLAWWVVKRYRSEPPSITGATVTRDGRDGSLRRGLLRLAPVSVPSSTSRRTSSATASGSSVIPRRRRR